ncbi:MAG: hypothetical protein EAZ42_05440 [Verrucomicrobia bacterium]|nr:MAG: hypothetical protein EAZ42_05440 [Verrucomicrobiota bacterium]
MKVVPTLAKGLRLEAEDASDWELLRYIIYDATMASRDLAESLNCTAQETDAADDWREYVMPDLREAFQEDLAIVAAAVETAIHHAKGEAGPLWIQAEQSFLWYSALNQARLSIEDVHHFATVDEFSEDWLDFSNSSDLLGFFRRNQFYGVLQTLLLEYVM